MMKFVKTTDEKLGETVCRGIHESGLTVILIKKKDFCKSYATFSTKYGSINTEFVVPGEQMPTKVIDGIAHFLEHKVFEQPDGTNAFNDFSKYGANANAFTSFAVTNYLFSCTDNFYENLEILLGFVQTPYFTEENVEKEKGIIAQEIRMYDDDADQVCYYNCLKAMYKNHPVRTEIAGSVEEIMKTTPELLYKCYKTFYHPSNMALICVGDLDEQRIAELVDKHIKTEKTQGSIVQVFPDEPRTVNKKYAEAHFDIPMPMFMLGFKDKEVGGSGADMLKREILTSCILRVLFGKSSPFYRRLYDSGLINKSFAAFYEYEDSFGYAAISGESRDPKAVEKEIYKTVSEAAASGIDREAFKRAKKVLFGSNAASFDSVEELGNEYMFAFHRGVELFDYPEICMSLTAEEADARIKELFDKECGSLSVVLPKKMI